MAKTLVIPPVINQEYEYVAVDLLRPNPWNVNEGDTGAIYESIQENGFFGACLAQKSSGYIIIGEHRWRAAKNHGLPAVPTIYLDCDDDRAKRIMLADNRTARLGMDNSAALAELLSELAATPLGLFGTAWDGDDLDALISDLAGPNFEAVGADEQGRLDEKAKVTCPECGACFVPKT